jgi:hypothetical protein
MCTAVQEAEVAVMALVRHIAAMGVATLEKPVQIARLTAAPVWIVRSIYQIVRKLKKLHRGKVKRYYMGV